MLNADICLKCLILYILLLWFSHRSDEWIYILPQQMLLTWTLGKQYIYWTIPTAGMEHTICVVDGYRQLVHKSKKYYFCIVNEIHYDSAT